MSIATTVRARNASDLINEGARLAVEGLEAGSSSDSVVLAAGSDRALVVTGFSLTTDNGTPVLVSLGLKKGSDATMIFWQGYVSSGGPVTMSYAPENWFRGDLDYDVVISTAAGSVAYTVDMKRTSYPEPLGYLHRVGAQGSFDVAHSSRAIFPEQSGRDRGQMTIPGF